MISNSDRTILYGAMAFMAWQLYLQRKCACGQGGAGSSCEPPASNSPVPLWIQQLSAQYGGTNPFTPQCGIWGRCS